MMLFKKPELLAPAGDFEKLKMAVTYGADAVYIGGKLFGLRANAKNFDDNELKTAIEYAHDHHVKVYVAVNIYAKNKDFDGLESYLQMLKDINADAVLVADPGVLSVAQKISGLNIHISTQANVTNFESALFYKNNGASRIVLARELSLDEIKYINQKTAPFETEVFVHGAMCVSFSGRCLLSNYMTSRDGNQGDCAQPCRWKYHLMEDKRPGEYFPVYEDENGTYIMNSKDLCMIQHIPQLVASGVSSLKIEGRMKTAYYVAVVTRAYRQAIDDYFESTELYESKKDLYMKEILKSSHREFFTGFYLASPNETEGQSQESAVYTSTHEFIGIVQEYDAENKIAMVEQRNKFSVGDEVEFVMGGFTQKIIEMFDNNGAAISSAPHPQHMIKVRVDRPVEKYDIMRKEATLFVQGH